MALARLSEIAPGLTQEPPEEQRGSLASPTGFIFGPWGLLTSFSSAGVFPPWEKTGGLLHHCMLLWQDQWERQLQLFGALRSL